MEAKDKIEELLIHNSEKLNSDEPFEGHFERFEAKLKIKQKKKGIKINTVLKIAASVIFILLLGNQAYLFFSPNKNDSEKGMSLASVSAEYEEVEFYYNNAIHVGLNQWESFKSSGLISDEEQKMLDDELLEFEELYKNLQEDLEANPNDERVVNAMLEYYQAKLNVINMIVTKLQEVKQLNTTKNVEI